MTQVFSRLLFAVFFAAALIVASYDVSRAEDAAPVEGTEMQADTKAEVKEESKTEEPKAEAPKAEAKAEEQSKTGDVLDPAQAEKAEKYKNAASSAYAAVKEIGSSLKGDDAKHFFLMYNNYNMIGTVKVVQHDVGNAVKVCGEKNPDMKEAMDTRFKSWNEAVEPVVAEAEGSVNNMIIAQQYTDAAKIKAAFKKLDVARKATNDYAEKVPVTTPEACKHLLDKMDDTQDNLVKLLRTTLVSYGQVKPDDAAAPEEPAAEKAP